MVSDYVTEDGTWDWYKLCGIPANVKKQLASFLINQSMDDHVYWIAASNGVFLVSSAYKLLINSTLTNPIWSKVWCLNIPYRIKYFIWLLLHDRLLTKEACVRRRISATAVCPRCGTSTESTYHLLRDCMSSSGLWDTWLNGSIIEKFYSLTLQELIRFNLSRNNVMIDERLSWLLVFAFGSRFIWK
ncbi:hypothetical protein REPUB_Repub04eG0060800 [Reevesia pubescens]